MRIRRLSLMAAALCSTCAVAALAERDEGPLEVTITAPVTQQPWRETPASVTVVDEQARQGAQNLATDELFNRIPGVFALNAQNFSQGVRLSIRGFGSRANFGVRGVRVLLDGIPLTLPDGQTELDALDLGLLETTEVIRGSASTLYGNGAGGVVTFSTPEPPREPYSTFAAAAGEYGYRQGRAEAGGEIGAGWRALGAVSVTRQDGFRDHSDVRSDIYTAKLARQFSAGDLDITLNAVEIDSQDPGGISRADVRADRRQARDQNLLFDGGESISQQRMGVTWRAELSPVMEYSLRGWAGQREFDNRLPFVDGGQVDFERKFGGLAAALTRRVNWAGLAQQITVGAETEAQQDDRRRFDNNQGQRGAMTLDQEEKASSWALYVQDDIRLASEWLLTLGLRYDRVRLAVDDGFGSDGNDSGVRKLRDFSYSGALAWFYSPGHQLYARASTSFETPTVAELANPAGGGFNPVLGSADATNYELGLKGESGALRYELAAFRIQVEDELVSFELAGQPGRSFFRNAGESERRGVEASADWVWRDVWRFTGAYTWADYEYEDYVSGGTDFSGNELPGLPGQRLFAEVAYEQPDHYVRLNLKAYDDFFADDGNTARVAGYAVANLRAGWLFRAAGARWEPYAGINNLLDKDYNDNIRINAFGGRYFEPAPGRNVYAGLKATFY